MSSRARVGAGAAAEVDTSIGKREMKVLPAWFARNRPTLWLRRVGIYAEQNKMSVGDSEDTRGTAREGKHGGLLAAAASAARRCPPDDRSPYNDAVMTLPISASPGWDPNHASDAFEDDGPGGFMNWMLDTGSRRLPCLELCLPLPKQACRTWFARGICHKIAHYRRKDFRHRNQCRHLFYRSKNVERELER